LQGYIADAAYICKVMVEYEQAVGPETKRLRPNEVNSPFALAFQG
jgi:hypothetical protein